MDFFEAREKANAEAARKWSVLTLKTAVESRMGWVFGYGPRDESDGTIMMDRPCLVVDRESGKVLDLQPVSDEFWDYAADSKEIPIDD